MKPLILISLLFASEIFALEAYPGRDFSQVNLPVYCQAPSSAFFEQKLRENFHLNSGEKELKEIVTDPRNYSAREEIKSMKRQLVFANRIQSQAIRGKLRPQFQSMIENANRGDLIQDFPVVGSTSRLSASEETLVISMEKLQVEKLEFLPPMIREKLGDKIEVHYLYPFDKFDYVANYAGEALPLKELMGKIQDDFEESCLRNALEGQGDRKKRNWEIKNRGTGNAAQ